MTLSLIVGAFALAVYLTVGVAVVRLDRELKALRETVNNLGKEKKQ